MYGLKMAVFEIEKPFHWLYFTGSLLNKYSISRLRLYVSAQNLFFITNYSGLDPEIGIQGGNATQNGVDNGTYPSSRISPLD